jgi:C4-dicarboxylate-specific signal transduction histidine kinase
MAHRKRELDTRILTVFFVAAVPFVAFGAWLIIGMARGRLEESLGESLEQRALQTKLSIERYVGEQIVTLHLLALDPQVVQAVSAKETPSADHPLSSRLREIVQIRPNLRLLQVVDAQGRVVAASARSARVIPLGAAWKETLLGDDPSVRPFVGDIQRVPGTDSPALEVAFPIRGLTGEPRGIVRGLVDAADLYGVLSSVRIGRTGHALLLRGEDGLVLASDDDATVLKERFPGFASIQAALREKRGYWRVPPIPTPAEGEKTVLGKPERLVAYARVEQVPDVDWLVTVEQDVAEAMAPLTGVTRYLWIHFACVFAAVILLALYFSFKLEEPVIEEELHLHEEHVPASMRGSTP